MIKLYDCFDCKLKNNKGRELNLKKFKYVIVTPQAMGGGPIAMHALYKYLREFGENAKICYLNPWSYQSEKDLTMWKYYLFPIRSYIKISIKKFLNLFFKNRFIVHNAPKTKYRYKLIPRIWDKNTIVVYMDCTIGNPFKAKKVVRWLLYYNRYYHRENGKTINYDKDDLFFAYREVFNDEKLNPMCKKLFIPYYDLDLYKRTNFGERKGKCYILRKGAWRPDTPDELDGVVIDNLREEEIVKVFNECEYCISYDTQTSYSRIAAMCGCISVIVPEEGKTWRDYRTPEEKRELYGVAHGFDEDEISWAKNTQDKVRGYFRNLNDIGKNNVKNFIEEVENYFNS